MHLICLPISVQLESLLDHGVTTTTVKIAEDCFIFFLLALHLNRNFAHKYITMHTHTSVY